MARDNTMPTVRLADGTSVPALGLGTWRMGESARTRKREVAALRAGIRTVMVPKRNEKDLEDIPADAKAKLEFVFLEKIEDAIRTAIGELSLLDDKKAA